MSLEDYMTAPASFVRYVQCLIDGEADKERKEHERSMRNTKRGRRR